MSQTVCKFVSLLTACALLLGCLTGCGNEKEKKYKRLFDQGIVLANSVTVRTIDYDVPSGCYAEYFEIDGLADQAVEERINNRIFVEMEEMCRGEFIPPYRGIALKMKENADRASAFSVHIVPGFNSNNILSVNAACHFYFARDDYDNQFGYSYAVPMTFDLTTGEEMTLGDLFAPGTDYIGLLSRNVDECLMSGGFDGEYNEMGEYSSLRLVSPFKGLRPEQKFLINENGDIDLFFDYDTPEFYTHYNHVTLTLTSDMLGDGFTPFRVAETPLYEQEETNCLFVRRFDENPVEKTVWTDEIVGYYGRYHYLGGTPEKVVRQAEKITFDERQLPVSRQELEERVSRETGGKKKYEIITEVKTDACFNRSQRYYSFVRRTFYTVSTWTNPDSDFKTSTYSYTNAYCFDSDGRRLDYRSLFTQPENADELIRNAFLGTLKEQQAYSRLKWSDEQAQTLAERLLSHLNGAALDAEYLTVSYDFSFWDFHDVITDCLGKAGSPEDPDDENAFHTEDLAWELNYLRYADLGCENLVCFKDAFA